MYVFFWRICPSLGPLGCMFGWTEWISFCYSNREQYLNYFCKFFTAWIGSLGQGTTFLVSPISHLIYNRFGFTRLMTASILLCVSSWVTSSFVDDIRYLSLTYSLLWGAGAGFANYASTVIIQHSFRKHLSAATGISSSGTGLGTLVLGQLLTWMLERFGYKWTFRACALIPILFIFLLCSSYVQKKESRSTKMPPKLISENNDASNSSSSNSSVHGLTDDRGAKNDEGLLGEIPDSSNTNYHSDKNNNSSNSTDRDENDNLENSSLPNSKDDDDQTVILERVVSENNQISISSPPSHRKSFKLRELFDKDMWRNMKFVLFLGGVSLFLFGAFIPFIFLVSSDFFFRCTSQNVRKKSLNPLTLRQRSIFWQSEMLTAFSKTISNIQMWFLSWVLGSF